ncbi:MAG TPA: response regulator transcription factor [Chthoniobacteraceae bacterium]|jgi:DNA-binding NarL/FixJ family response regulator
MKTAKPIRLLIADDHGVVRLGLAAMLENAGDVEIVAEAETGREAVELYRRHRPDVCLLDLRMPGLNGFEVIDLLRREFTDPGILVVSTYDRPDEIHRALELGARGYLLKDVVRTDLVDAVRTVYAGKRYLPEVIRERVGKYEPPDAFSERELEVLRLVAKGLSNREAAQRLYVTERTVKFHMTNLLVKLGVRDRTEAVTEGLRRGFVELD